MIISNNTLSNTRAEVDILRKKCWVIIFVLWLFCKHHCSNWTLNYLFPPSIFGSVSSFPSSYLGKRVREESFRTHQYFILVGCRAILPFILIKTICYPCTTKALTRTMCWCTLAVHSHPRKVSGFVCNWVIGQKVKSSIVCLYNSEKIQGDILTTLSLKQKFIWFYWGQSNLLLSSGIPEGLIILALIYVSVQSESILPTILLKH